MAAPMARPALALLRVRVAAAVAAVVGGGGGGFAFGGGGGGGGVPGAGGTGTTRPTPNATQIALRAQFANRIPTALMNALVYLSCRRPPDHSTLK